MLEEHEKESGLEVRYDVTRIGDTAGKHDECRYFVLDPQHDPIAVEVLRTYALHAGAAGFFQLREDLHDWLDEVEGKVRGRTEGSTPREA